GRAVALIDVPNPLSRDLARRVEIVGESLDWLADHGRRGLLDGGRMALAGPAFGGATSVVLQALDERIRTVVALAPGWPPSPIRGPTQRTHELMERVLGRGVSATPFRVIGAKNDRVVPAEHYARHIARACANCD